MRSEALRKTESEHLPESERCLRVFSRVLSMGNLAPRDPSSPTPHLRTCLTNAWAPSRPVTWPDQLRGPRRRWCRARHTAGSVQVLASGGCPVSVNTRAPAWGHCFPRSGRHCVGVRAPVDVVYFCGPLCNISFGSSLIGVVHSKNATSVGRSVGRSLGTVRSLGKGRGRGGPASERASGLFVRLPGRGGRRGSSEARNRKIP